MKIEIDTNADRKEELRHIAHMLLALCNEVVPSRVADNAAYDAGYSSQQDFFKNPAPTSQASSGEGSFFNMFGDPAPSPPLSSMQPAIPREPAQQPAGDLFSLFQDNNQSPPSNQSLPSIHSSIQPSEERLSKKRDFLAEGHLIPYD